MTTPGVHSDPHTAINVLSGKVPANKVEKVDARQSTFASLAKHPVISQNTSWSVRHTHASCYIHCIKQHKCMFFVIPSQLF